MELPALDVRTVAVDDPGALIECALPSRPTAFLRSGDGIVGLGERLRLTATGTGRTVALAAQWRDLAGRALVSDDVRLAGSGLVAFGSFVFSEESGDESALIVPSVIVGRRDGRAWITTIDGGMPVARSPLGAAPGAQLLPGAMTPEAFTAAVSAATAAIADGRADKVVIARDLRGSIPPDADRRPVVARLAEAYPDTFAFAVDGLVGASPETLVRVEGGDVSARVLAGTAARWTDAATDVHAATSLAASPKNRSEHAMAVQSVLDTITPHATDVTHTTPFALRLPNLWHLATDVRGSLVPGSTVLDLVAVLHPTAAVAGAPTDAALELIAELEPSDRGRYAGPVGWVDGDGDGEWAIALRCATIGDEGTVTAWAGAGIVADSDPEAELAETVLKFQPMVQALSR